MKKFNKIICVFGTVALLGTMSGCDSYFDLNTNPNQVANPPLKAMLSTATKKAGNNSYSTSSITSTFVQYIANPSAGASSDTYQIVDYSTTWDNIYYAMADITDMKNAAIAQGSSEYLGVANTLLAYHVSLVNNLWGAGPFTDAFGGSFTPSYETEEDMYNISLSLIDEAITELSKSDATIKLDATSDLIHRGNREAWLKTAYALKARFLNKISKKSSYNPGEVLAALENAYTSNADDAGMYAFTTRNDWAQLARNNAALTLGGWLSEQLIDHLNGTTYGLFDPRIEKITDPTTVPDNPTYPKWIGTVNGEGNRDNPPHNNTVKDENYVSVNSPLTSETAPLWLITYAELKFIEAEASFATDKTRSYNAYLAGIKASMDKLEVANADATTYISNPIVSVGSAALTKQLIFKEKYVATYLNTEAWTDVRRNDYDYKDFTLPTNAVLPNYIRRVAYPTNERSENGANVPAEVSLDTKIWWDQP